MNSVAASEEILGSLLDYLAATDRMTAEQLANLSNWEHAFPGSPAWQAADQATSKMIAANVETANLYCDQLRKAGYSLTARHASGRLAVLHSIEYSVKPRGYMLHVPEDSQAFWPLEGATLQLNRRAALGRSRRQSPVPLGLLMGSGLVTPWPT